jgi:ribose/xylose/arabinose/galactoside ABC-type transport system permease subunit
MLSKTGKSKKWINNNNRSIIYLLGIVVAAIGIMALLDAKFITARNLFNIVNQQASIGIVTMGVSIALICGCIDLTVGNLLASSAAVAALMLRADLNPGLVVLLTCVIGLAAGALNGIIVVKTRINTFIATLGLMSIYQGIALIIPKGVNVYLQGRFSKFGTYRIGGLVPIPIIYFITIALLVYFVMRYTKFGRKLYSIGGNEEASHLAGINIDVIKISAYSISGLFASFTSLIVISRIGQSQPAMGSSYPLEAIAAAVIGGVPLAGGRGKVHGVFLGVILLGLMRNSLNILRVTTFYQYIMIGVVIIVAVTLSRIGTNNR